MRADLLVWLERALLAVGLVLAVWSLMVVTEARFFSTLPVPAPPPAPPAAAAAGRSLPGDAGEARPAADVARAPVFKIGDWVARLDAPSVDLSATVLEGSDDATLARAAGHIEYTPLPGEGGNVGIAAHRDTIFRPVRRLKTGDVLHLTTAREIFDYRITATKIVNPEDVYVLDPTDHPTLTLVTCYPFNFIGHAPKRFIITAALTGKRPR